MKPAVEKHTPLLESLCIIPAEEIKEMYETYPFRLEYERFKDTLLPPD